MIQEEVSTLVSKICLQAGPSPMKTISPTGVASPASLSPTSATHVQGGDNPG